VVAGIQARLNERSTSAALTPREIEVLIASGCATNRRLAAHQREDHSGTSRTCFSLKVNDRTAAVNVALKRGIIHLYQPISRIKSTAKSNIPI
jgi:hypothetical protein